MPQVVAVFLVQYYRAAGVLIESLAAWLPEFELERCWIYTSLGVLLQLVSIELEIVYAWLLVILWHVARLEHGKALVRLRSPLCISSLLLNLLHC